MRSDAAAGGRRFALEGNPDADKKPAPVELDSLIDDEKYRDFRVLPDRMVKVKQIQDNVQFAAMVESVDESFGRILTKLVELGLDEQTIVIFTLGQRRDVGGELWKPRASRVRHRS